MKASLRRLVATAGILAWAWAPAAAAEPAPVRIAYLAQERERPVPLSLLETVPDDEGVAGARQAIAENNTTGRFTGQAFELAVARVPSDGDPAAAFRELTGRGFGLILADLPRARLLEVADLPEATGTLIFNVGARDDSLRNADCRANVLHSAPSRAMLADALAQYLAWKKWRRWFLLRGESAQDIAYARALERAAKRFGAEIVGQHAYAYEAGARRTDTGHVLVQRQMPVLTQDLPDHDVLVVADESEVFGDYLMYRTWEPTLVAGTHGLVPAAWDRVHEQWGATQLQRRFERTAARWMRPRDYAAWVAVRSIGEGATRSGSTAVADIAGYVRGPEFQLAAFMGQGVSYRPWNGQLRQPILLAGPRTLVSVSPQKGFLHRVTELDTLGYDRPESGCRLP